MKCPHCLTGLHEDWSTDYIGADASAGYQVRHMTCPECYNFMIQLGITDYGYETAEVEWRFVQPKSISRTPVSPDVDDSFLKKAYEQACLVLADSAMASAALSRRCLQHILREKAGVAHKDLIHEIQEVIDSNQLPTNLENDLDAVRNIGNFAAHPTKSTRSGEVMEVEPGEAEWNLDVVEGLIDFYFVRPAESVRKRMALNEKLKEAGKPELSID